MYTGIFFSIEALFYLGLLLLVYFKKKVFKSRENKIYSILVIVTFIELLTEIILDIVGPLYQAIPKISYSVAKIYCIFYHTSTQFSIGLIELQSKKRKGAAKWSHLYR